MTAEEKLKEYITIESKSDDCCAPYSHIILDEVPLTKEERRKQYYPFFEKPIIRRIE